MNINPYASPQSNVDLPTQAITETPALWNPNAAANWSLILTPAFGAYLHMKNWHALGEAQHAAKSKRWVIATFVILSTLAIFGAFFPDGASRIAGIFLLVAWYFTSARYQAVFVKQRFGTTYVRKKWSKPLLYGVLAVVAYFVATLSAFLALQWLAKHFL